MTTASTKRDEASADAPRPAERTKTQAELDKAAEVAAKDAQIRAEADAQFREDVAKAQEKRDKRLAKLSTGTDIVEQAWNETKADDDPPYNALAADHLQKLRAVETAVRETGNADVIGLEAFEERLRELINEQGGPTGTALVPSAASGRPETEETAEDTKTKGGK